MQYKEILDKLKSLFNPENVAGMARYGINPEKSMEYPFPPYVQWPKRLDATTI